MADVGALRDWVLRLRPGETPIFRHTRASLLELAQKGESLTSRELAQPILADPLATLRLVYAANNRTTRHIASEVATVEHALMMQGVLPFLEKIATLPVLEDTPAAKDKVALATLYRQLRIAQHAAWQARDFAVLHADTRAEESQVTALLYYAPEFLFWLQAPEAAQELARLRRRMPSAEAEEKALGFQLTSLRLAMLEAWKIPEANRDLLNEDLAARPRQTLLRACLDIANRSRHGWWDPGLADAYQAIAGLGNLALDEIITTVHDNAVRVARSHDWVPAPPAAAWLAMLPGEWPSEPDEEPEPTAEVSEPRPVTEPAPAVKAPALTSNARIFKDALQDIGEHLDGSRSLNQVSAVILKGLHSGLGLSRILFAMVTPDGLRVKCRFTLGIRADDPLRRFEFPIAQTDLFGKLMTRMQGIWINDENHARLWPMIDKELRKTIGQGDFYAMSLFASDKPIGLVYADRGHGDTPLDAQTYSDFKTFCLQAGRGLGKIKA
jgi:hypothetical protein